jgi:hypothetical protein
MKSLPHSALIGAFVMLCTAGTTAAIAADAAPVDTASTTNANPALPRPAADPTTDASIETPAASNDDVGEDADAPPPGSSGGGAKKPAGKAAASAAPAAASAKDDIGSDADSPPPGSSSAKPKAQPKPQPKSDTKPVAADAAPAADTASSAPKADSADVHAPRPAREPKTAWWGQSSRSRFGVEYVGQAVDKKALLIRFTREVKDSAAAQSIKLIDSSGKPVPANWQQGDDARVLIAPDLKPGRYRVEIDSQLASTGGETLGGSLKGKSLIK